MDFTIFSLINKHRVAVSSTIGLSRRQKIILLHCRLGHLTVLYLRRLFMLSSTSSPSTNNKSPSRGTI